MLPPTRSGACVISNSVLILIVEDDGLIRHVVQEALTDGGYAVETACTGEEAFNKLDAPDAAFRALVTDIDLVSGMLTGWDVARHAREITPELPVIYMTGASASDWSSQGVPKSVLLTKPFAPSQVVTAVSQLLNANASAAE